MLAANDGLGNAAIAVLKKNKLNGEVPVTGQDATVQGLQNILAGDQCMTVYKAIKKEADAAAELAIALAKGEKPAATGRRSWTRRAGGRCRPCCWSRGRSPGQRQGRRRRRLRHQGRALHRRVRHGLRRGRHQLTTGCARRAGPPGPRWAARGRHRQAGHRTKETTVAATPLLELRGIDKSFGPVQVLHDVGLSVYPGEVTALVGDNGAGKSTLVKCISGIYTTDAGTVLFEGRQVAIHSPRDAAALGIEVVYQDLALCDNLDIVQNMFLGREKKRGIVLDEATMEEMAGETLDSLSVRTVKSLRQPVSSLSGGQRQTVAIAKAVLWNSRLVILDEPTAALGVAQTAQVLELVRRLADNGLAVVLISHNMNDVFAVSDRIAALYLGRMAAQVKATDVTHSQVVELITAGRSGNLGLPPGTADSAALHRHHAGRRRSDHHDQQDGRRRRRAHGRQPPPRLLGAGARRRPRHPARGARSHRALSGLRRPRPTSSPPELRQPVQPGRRGHLHRDGPGLRPAAGRDRPLRRFRQRRLRRGHGHRADQQGLPWYAACWPPWSPAR